MDPRFIDLYDECTHKPLPRSEFLKRLTKLAGGAAAVVTRAKINFCDPARGRI